MQVATGGCMLVGVGVLIAREKFAYDGENRYNSPITFTTFSQLFHNIFTTPCDTKEDRNKTYHLTRGGYKCVEEVFLSDL
jgi:hypothetical protein